MTRSTRAGRLAATVVGATLLIGSLSLAASTTTAQAAAAKTVVTGTIVADGLRQAGLTVKLRRLDPDSGDSYTDIRSTTTSANGVFTFSSFTVSPGGGYELWYEDPDRDVVAGKRPVEPVAGKSVTRNITARVGSIITGQVRYTNGAQPSHARVLVDGYVAEADGGDQLDPAVEKYVYPREMAVDSSGNFTLKGLPRGKYRLTYTDTTHYFYDICHDGSREKINPSDANPSCLHVPEISVGIGTETAVPRRTFVDRAAQIIGMVTNSKGQRVDAIVYVHEKGQAGEGIRADTSDGIWRATDLPAGSWEIEVQPYGAYATRWYLDGATRAQARPVTTTTGEKVIRQNVVVPKK